jgi:hypothetical protein
MRLGHHGHEHFETQHGCSSDRSNAAAKGYGTDAVRLLPRCGLSALISLIPFGETPLFLTFGHSLRPRPNGYSLANNLLSFKANVLCYLELCKCRCDKVL